MELIFMKKEMALSVVALFASITFAVAQAPGGSGGGQRITVEERIKALNDKLADLKLDDDKLAKTDSVFTAYYADMQKQRDDMRAAGAPPDRDAMRDKMLKMNIDRDEKLKIIFTDDQFKKWKSDIEPALRPQRQNKQQ